MICKLVFAKYCRSCIPSPYQIHLDAYSCLFHYGAVKSKIVKYESFINDNIAYSFCIRMNSK